MWRVSLTVCFLVAFSGHALAQADNGQSIEWFVEERFRLWSQDSSSVTAREHEELLHNLSNAADATEFYDLYNSFLSEHSDLHLQSRWDRRQQLYHSDYVFPESYSVRLSAPAEWQGEACIWQTSGGVLEASTAPCTVPVGLTIPSDRNASGSQAVQVSVQRQSDSASLEIGNCVM